MAAVRPGPPPAEAAASVAGRPVIDTLGIRASGLDTLDVHASGP
ncbi:hypothetical protein [Streptomyces sp. NPDC002328]